MIVDDSYNASPESMIAALNLLDDMDARRRVAVLGDMLELGEYEEQGHRMVGKRAADVVDKLITIGKRAEIIAEEAQLCGLSAKHIIRMSDRESAQTYLRENLSEGDVVLVKGSHGMRLDRMVSALEIADERSDFRPLARHDHVFVSGHLGRTVHHSAQTLQDRQADSRGRTADALYQNGHADDGRVVVHHPYLGY